jgi:hypothetical protein
MTRGRLAVLAKLALAALLGAAAAALVACGSSGNGLIPAAQAGPLQGDIEAVEKAAEEGNGNCSATEAALLRTDRHFVALPSSLDSTLRGKLKLGIENLHKVAMEACLQALPLTNTVTTPRTTTTTTPTTTTPTTPTTTTTNTTTTPPPSGGAESEETEHEHGTGGGTPAPGESKPPGAGPGGAGSEESGGGNGAGGAGN